MSRLPKIHCLEYDLEPMFIDMLVSAPPGTVTSMVECNVLNGMEVVQLEAIAEATIAMRDMQESVSRPDIQES